MQINGDIPFLVKAAGGPFQDPAVLLCPPNSSSYILLDCGTLHGLKTRDLLRVEWLFLSHLHIDHLIGFDHLLRLRLFSENPLRIFGPPGTVEAISHRLQGYAWNLTSGSPFVVEAWEADIEGKLRGSAYPCHDRFLAHEILHTPRSSEKQQLDLSDSLALNWTTVEHGVPCFCFRLVQTYPPRFSPEMCHRLGLTPGPWVKKLISGELQELKVDGKVHDRDTLVRTLLTQRPSFRLGYLTDTLLNSKLREKLVVFYGECDLLLSECAYLSEEAELAQQNLHMHTGQVADLARQAEVKELRVFHFSRRNQERGNSPYLEELRATFPNTRVLEKAPKE